MDYHMPISPLNSCIRYAQNFKQQRTGVGLQAVNAHFGSPVTGRSSKIWAEKSWWINRKTIKPEWQK